MTQVRYADGDLSKGVLAGTGLAPSVLDRSARRDAIERLARAEEEVVLVYKEAFGDWRGGAGDTEGSWWNLHKRERTAIPAHPRPEDRFPRLSVDDWKPLSVSRACCI